MAERSRRSVLPVRAGSGAGAAVSGWLGGIRRCAECERSTTLSSSGERLTFIIEKPGVVSIVGERAVSVGYNLSSVVWLSLHDNPAPGARGIGGSASHFLPNRTPPAELAHAAIVRRSYQGYDPSSTPHRYPAETGLEDGMKSTPAQRAQPMGRARLAFSRCGPSAGLRSCRYEEGHGLPSTPTP